MASGVDMVGHFPTLGFRKSKIFHTNLFCSIPQTIGTPGQQHQSFEFLVVAILFHLSHHHRHTHLSVRTWYGWAMSVSSVFSVEFARAQAASRW